VLDFILAFYVLPKACKCIDQPISLLIKDTLTDTKELWMDHIIPLALKRKKMQ
jgi:hypothetical protein